MAARRRREPLEVDLTVVVRFGEAEEDRVVLMEERRLAMIGSIFRYRDRIARFLVTGLVRAAMLQPKVARRVLPGIMLRKDS